MASSKDENQLEEVKKYGNMVAGEIFSGKLIRLYDKGYVRVGGAFIRSGTAFERLHGISGSADVTKKLAIGRAAGFALTGGLNMLSPNKRGDIYLTIVTDVKTHSLHMSPPTKAELQAMHKLVTAGEIVLEKLGKNSASGDDIISKLEKISELHSAGVLSDAEFANLKAKIMNGDQ